MRILVTGVGGQLGTDVVAELKKRGHEVIGVTQEDLDITEEAKVTDFVMNTRPEAIIHCAAYTAVDAAEDNYELAYQVNCLGTRYLVRACKNLGGKFIYISTDYVFSGDGDQPWKVDDIKNPQNNYGKTKLLGEEEVKKYTDQYFIVRTSWVIGAVGKNFVKTMLQLGKTRGAVSVVNDQIGSPTFTRNLSTLLSDMVVTNRYGVYHATNEGECSWYEFAVEIFSQAKLNVTVTPVSSSEFVAKAVRPKNSRLDKECLTENGFHLLPDWKSELCEYLKTIIGD